MMLKHITARRCLAIVALGLGCGGWLAFQGCSGDRAEPRALRGHSRIIQGVAHANPADYAERQCSYCHGVALAGGAHGEPGCFTCHGRNWFDAAADALTSTAPADHTLDNQGFRHHPDLFNPTGTCVSCHGAELEGDPTRPGCDLCHEKLWETRTAPTP